MKYRYQLKMKVPEYLLNQVPVTAIKIKERNLEI